MDGNGNDDNVMIVDDNDGENGNRDHGESDNDEECENTHKNTKK